MEATTKDFHIGDVLSITHDVLVSPSHVGGVYGILNFVLSDELYTHQLPRASRSSKEFLLAQHPQLREVSSKSVTPENWRQWLDEQVGKYGEMLPVRKMNEEELQANYKHMGMIEELVQMKGGTEGILIVATE